MRDVLRLGRDRRDAAVLERLLQLAEVGERAAEDELRLALLAGALAHLLEPVVDELELELVRVEPRRVRGGTTPMRLNRKATLPVLPMLPPPLLKCVRTLATVRVGLSVAVSTSTATPCGA